MAEIKLGNIKGPKGDTGPKGETGGKNYLDYKQMIQEIIAIKTEMENTNGK